MKASLTDWGLLVLRIGLGLVMLFYGCQKMFGLFHGPGFGGILSFFQTKMGIPPLFGVLAIFAEFFGSLGVLVGLLTRWAAFGLMCTLAVATYFNAQGGALGNIFATGNPADASKVLFTFVLMMMAAALLLTGPGALSLDARVFKPKAGKK
jgi:putative oxidoreductase